MKNKYIKYFFNFMIIRIPENKNIYYKHHLNEGFFDDEFFDEIDTKDEIGDELGRTLTKSYEEETLKPYVEKILKQLGVENFEITCTGNSIVSVDVHDHLYLPNKKLNNLSFTAFYFNKVDGNCNYNGNNLTDWKKFPKYIGGNLYANFNNLKNFEGSPIVTGNVIANKQNKKTDYPLTNDNYINFKNYNITENSVFALPINKIGELYSICENDNTCIIEFKDKSRQKFKLNDIEYLGNLENLLIL